MDLPSSSLPPVDAASDAAPTVLDADRVSLGQMVRLARQQRGLTLQQISEMTNIQLAHLEAYERDDLAGTVPGMYQRAEIRAIADAVGLDSRAALTAAERPAPPHIEIPKGLPDPAAPLAILPAAAPTAIASVAAPVARQRARRSIKGDVAVATLTVAVVALGWFAFRAPHSSKRTQPQPVAAVAHEASVTPPRSFGSERQERSNTPALPAIPSASSAPAERRATNTVIERAGNEVVADGAAAPVAPSLRVITEPAGARVTVDGVGWGQTPLTIRYLPPGAKRIRVTHDGYLAREQVIAITSDQPQTVVRMSLRRR